MRRLTLICAGCSCALLAACASEGPRPTEQLTAARTLVTQADKSEAQRYDAADLQKAHDELNGAETADSQRKYNDARRLAESAAVDADVAAARAQAATAQHAAHEVEQSNAALRTESARAAAAEGNPPPPQSSPPTSSSDLQSYPPATPGQPPPQ
jgi:membrane-bound lytic murein transglycosylase